MTKTKGQIGIGLVILLVAFAIRLLGIQWGLPNGLHNQSYHPDEPIVWAYSQQVDPASLKFTPGFYNYGTLYLTLARVASASCPVPDTISPATLAEFERCCEQAGRYVSALAGAFAAWICFEILRRRTGLLGAVLGAVSLAIAPAFLVHSRFQTVDTVACSLVFASIYCALRLLPDDVGESEHYQRWALLSGLFAGLAAGAKYNSAIVLIAPLVAIALCASVQKPRLLILAIVACVLAFLVATPGFLLEHDKFMEGLRYEMGHTATGHGLVFVDTGPGAMFHLYNLFVGYGGFALAIGTAGLVYAAYRRHRWAWVVAAFALLYFILIATAQVRFLRYTFPLYLPLSLGLGWAAGRAQVRPMWGRAAVIVAILALGGQARWSAIYTAWMMGPDPRDAAGEYLKESSLGRPGVTVGLISDPWFYSPAVYPDVTMSRPQYERVGPAAMAAAVNPKVVLFTPDQKPEYVAFSSLESRDLDRLRNSKSLSGPDQARVDQWKAIVARLQSEYKADRAFGAEPRAYVHDLEYIHPEVFVWKRKDLP